MFGRASVSIRYPVRPNPEAWVIPEEPVPESTAHDAALLRIYLLLSAWAEQRPGRVRVARDLAVRWLEQYPRTGINPDVCVLDPAPPELDDDLSSLCLWKEGHCVPRFCVEVVSHSHPYKDYTSIQERYAALGTPELLVFDPLLYGPRALGGPVLLQLWRRDSTGVFERMHFGADPVYSHALDAWIMVEGRELTIAEDRSGTRRWLTALERERAALTQERAALAQERAEREQERAELERERAARAKLEAELLALRTTKSGSRE
jgi:Uma2 family endonuclease